MMFNVKYEDLLTQLKDIHDNDQKTITELQKKLNEYNKDKEIQLLNQEIENMRKNSLIILGSSEKEKIDAFRKKHYLLHKDKGFHGNCYIYRLTGNGIGECVEITCPFCNESEDVTDITHW